MKNIKTDFEKNTRKNQNLSEEEKGRLQIKVREGYQNVTKELKKASVSS